MFSKYFESKTPENYITDINLEQKDDEFRMMLTPAQKEKTKYLKGKIDAVRRGHNLDTAVKQNFKISCDESLGTVTIVGNLFNAFEILKKYKLISQAFIDEIEGDPEVKPFLEKTKNFILLENRTDIFEDEEDKLTYLQEDYVSALVELDPKEFQSAIEGFINSLQARGIKIEYSTEKSNDTIKVVNK